MTVRPLRVAMIGHGFMGAAHSQAWRNAPRFFDLPRPVELAVLVGHDASRAQAAADRFGWAECATDWPEVVRRADVDVVDVVAPGALHAPVSIAALQARKHVLVEKPMANTLAEAETMADAARRAPGGALAMVGFTYRRLPAVTLAARLVARGEIGEVRQARAVYLQDWLSDASAPLTWRLQRETAGSGALGDLGAHLVDAVQFVTGQTVTAVSGTTQTFVTQRPVPGRAERRTGVAGASGHGPVTVDDTAVFTGRLSGGALATFEATRMAPGRKNGLRFEISGTDGGLAFDLEDLNSLQLYRFADGELAGFRRILVTEPAHPYLAAWWPPGHLLGYEHGFTHQAVDLLRAIDRGEQPRPSFEDGLHVQRVLDGVLRSAADDARWTPTAPRTISPSSTDARTQP